MLDTQKPLDIAITAATTAGDRVQELARNNLLTPVRVSRKVIQCEGGVVTGEPYVRSLNKTTADLLSHDTIVQALRAEFPEYPILSEEEYSHYDSIPTDTPYFIVDPIDGTIHLEKGRSQWTINVALCLNGAPLAGVVVVPAENKVFIGLKGLPSVWSNRDALHLSQPLQTPHRDRADLIVSECHPLDVMGGTVDSTPRSFYRQTA